MKYLLVALCCMLSAFTYAQKIPKGFTERLSYPVVGGGTADNFKPALYVKAVVEDKPEQPGSRCGGISLPYTMIIKPSLSSSIFTLPAVILLIKR